jgi:hypothetical protein
MSLFFAAGGCTMTRGMEGIFSMAKKTGVENRTGESDNENKTGTNDNTVKTVRRIPRRTGRGRKKIEKIEAVPDPAPSADLLPGIADDAPDAPPDREDFPPALGAEDLTLPEAPTIDLPPEEFTLSDFIPNEVIAKLEPVLEKQPISKRKSTSRRGRKPKSTPEPASKNEPVIKTVLIEELIPKKTSPITEPVIKTKPKTNPTTRKKPRLNVKKGIKTEPVILTEPNKDAAPKIPPKTGAVSDIKKEPVIETKPKTPLPAKSISPELPVSHTKADYAAAEFSSVQAMSSLKGFAPLGMLFILMDVLNGAEEGLIRVNRLAKALSIGKPAMLAQLENLERAGLIRTTSSSQQGRHVELLIPNRVARTGYQETRDAEARLLPDALPHGAPHNFSLQKLRELQNFLTDHGVRLVSLPDESGLDSRLPPIAAFLGKYLTYIQPFYTRLKATLNVGEEIQFSLLGFPGRDVTHILNFCKMLKDAGFLAAFTYRRAPYCTVVARLARTPAAINFLSGGWLEHYIRDKVVSILTTHPSTMDTPYAFMKNPRIILPGEEDFEFDFLLLIGSSVFWIEAKTGEYMDYIAKYSRVSKLLDLNRNNNLLVLVDAPKPDSNISARYGISCCSVDEFAEVFRLAMVRELARSKRGA